MKTLTRLMFITCVFFPTLSFAGFPLSTSLSGDEEAPGPGDPDGEGFATIVLKPLLGEICYLIDTDDIADATAAHIHKGAFGVAGPAVVTLELNDDDTFIGCVDADRDLIVDIISDPDDYYINVHNADYPDGAIRGQFGW